jgi:hypothetical protein
MSRRIARLVHGAIVGIKETGGDVEGDGGGDTDVGAFQIRPDLWLLSFILKKARPAIFVKNPLSWRNSFCYDIFIAATAYGFPKHRCKP